jgi:hypothetical protein
MSMHTNYDDRSRYHSALDLSPNDQHTSQEDFEDTQTITASSVTGSWSPYSTRVWTITLRTLHLLTKKQLSPHHVSPCVPSRRSPSPHTLNIRDLTEYLMPPYHGSFSPVEPLPGYDSSIAPALFTLFAPPSLPFSAPSHHTVSSTLPLDVYTDTDTISCAHCNQNFTGTYRNGNLARHVRQKHAGAYRSLYECTAQGCSKVFQRQDARLKHARKKHPELHSPPIQRRHGTENYRATSSGHEVIHAAHDLDFTKVY